MKKIALPIIFALFFIPDLKSSTRDSWTPQLASIAELEYFNGDFETPNIILQIQINNSTIIYKGKSLICTLHKELILIHNNCKPYDDRGNQITPSTFAAYKNNFEILIQELIRQLNSIIIINSPIRFDKKQFIRRLIDKIKHKQKTFNLKCKQIESIHLKSCPA